MSNDKKLGDHVQLPARDVQSTGDLYDLFLSRNDRGVHKWHHYFDVYERHLGRFRGTAFRVLEIGVSKGGSLSMWSEFFGPEARIVGVDVDPQTLAFDGRWANVTVRIGDQADPAFLASLDDEFGPFDVVIDDGGHTARQQINSFNLLYPRMTERGVYICEDTHTSYWPQFADAGPGVTMIEHAKKMIDHLHLPYLGGAKAFARFGVRPEDRKGNLQVTRFAAETFSVLFYDSMIVFERRARAEPFREIR
ncbi:hypothetical protein BAL199_11666 [alpha proteobacterium BAL199]|jgi:hypothetical protein|nr:hypothetical protein BAL199_11666 [alpha proteobacterium BAL199]